MLHADIGLAIEPAWPWSLPAVGLPALCGVALLLIALTVWTYVGVSKATWRRVGVVLILRLAALVLAVSMVMRPSFAVTHLEGVEPTRLLVVFDASESMNVAEIEGKPSRWEQVTKLWESREVQRRLEELRREQKIEIVKYLGAEDLRADEPLASANGKRTDIGAWLHQLWQKHAHEKHLRGVVIFSDGADNGVRYSAQEKARAWRGVAPIHAFGVGNPDDPKFRKDIGLTSLEVKEKPVAVRSKMTLKAVAQAPGFGERDVEITVLIEGASGGKPRQLASNPKFRIKQEKDQPISIVCVAPEEPGEYKLTLKITPHPDEANKENNEISTYVQIIKEKINVLWVDRLRVYEPTYAIRFALRPEQRFRVYFVETLSEGKGDPVKFYEFDKRHYDVIVIGDISARQFSLGDPRIFDKINEMVTVKNTGLLMLGGTETFAKGGWHQHKAITDLLPVKLDPKKVEFSKEEVRAELAKGALDFPFLKLDPNAKNNEKLWNEEFDPLDGLAPVGGLNKDSTELLNGKNGAVVMAATRKGAEGHVVVFAGDSTSRAWFGSKEAIAGFKRFWKQLVFWLANQEDQANQLHIDLDKRRLNANAGEILGFRFSLRGKSGTDLPGAAFKAKVVGPRLEYPVQYVGEEQHQRGTFQGAKEPGEHRLVIEGKAKDLDGSEVEKKGEARFLVAFDDIEMLRPLAEHETLSKIAANAEGRFYVLQEQALLQYLDELRNQVNRESRQKTMHWPDWQRVPASDHMRDQISGLWSSFALVGFLLFVGLVGGEWLLRRLWGLV
jgi:hypothetical protein